MHMHRVVLAWWMLMGCCLLLTGLQPVAAAGKQPDFVPGELLVKTRGGPGASAAAHARVGAKKLRSFGFIGWEHVKLPPGLTVAEGIARYKKQTGVLAVEPNYLGYASAVPDDPLYGQLWGMAKIQAPAAWDIATGSAEVVVAVLDTGVDYTHADLAANMWQNPGEIPGNGVDDDGNGYVDDIYGIDAANGDANPLDDHGHGTHCAGTIGAVGNNSLGVAGVNWNVRIMALKFMKPTQNGGSSGSYADAITCYQYATALRANGINVRVVNNSWGGSGFAQSLKDAFDAAGAAGVVSCCAAGNDGLDNEVVPHYPASFTSDSIIAVAASTQTDQPASFTNSGATSVDLAAPGVSILSTVNGGYESWQGTSMATPHVTGAAALLSAARPSLTVAQCRTALLTSVDVLPAWSGKVATGGRLNLKNALDALPPEGLDHFVWDEIASPQRVGTAFSATVTAVDAGGATVADFNGTVTLTGFVLNTQTIIFTDGVWTGDLTPTTDNPLVSLLASDGNGHTGESNTFAVLPLPPPAPSHPNPADSAVDVPIDTDLSWNNDPSGEGTPQLVTWTYTVRFGLVNPPVNVIANVFDTRCNPNTLQYSTTYYWQVTCTDLGGETSGPVWSFTTAAAPPPALDHFIWDEIPSPQRVGTAFTATVTAVDVDGHAVTDFHGPATMTGLVIDQQTITFTHGVWTGELSPTIDSPLVSLLVDDGASHTGESNTFAVLPLPPPAPSHPNPADGAVDVPVDTDLSWNNMAPGQATAQRVTWNYTVTFGTVNPPVDPIYSGYTAQCDPGALQHSTTYYWQVVCDDLGGATPGPIWSFTTAAAAPEIDHFVWQAIASPQRVGTAFSATITAVDANGNAVTDFNGSATISGPVIDTQPITFTGGAWTGELTPTADGLQAVLHVDDGAGHAGDSNAFDVLPPLPPAPNNPSPAHGATGVSIQADLTWNVAAPGQALPRLITREYTVRFGTADPPTAEVYAGTLTTCDPGALQCGATYYWQVIAHDLGGDTPGPVWSFRANCAPVAADGTLRVPTETPANGTMIATDDDNEPLRFELVKNGARGVAQLIDESTGAFTYTPNPGESGTDQVTFVARDRENVSNEATIWITIGDTVSNAPPKAVRDFFTMRRGETLQASIPGVLANDTDTDGDELTVRLTQNVRHGELTLNEDGTFTYVPNAGFVGRDWFHYRAFDGTMMSNTAKVTITVLDGAANLAIDVLPGIEPNVIRLDRRELVPVALLGGKHFNVRTVQERSCMFAGAPVYCGAGKSPVCEYRDVNGDGYTDLVLYFATTDMTLTADAVQGTLHGLSGAKKALLGIDAVVVEP